MRPCRIGVLSVVLLFVSLIGVEPSMGAQFRPKSTAERQEAITDAQVQERLPQTSRALKLYHDYRKQGYEPAEAGRRVESDLGLMKPAPAQPPAPEPLGLSPSSR